MFKKVIFLLGVGYVAGNIASSIYGSKKGSEVQKDLELAKKNGEDGKRVIYDSVIDTNLNLYEAAKECLFSTKNQRLLKKKKKELLDTVSSLKSEAMDLFEDLKKSGKEKTNDAIDAIEDFYKTKKSELKSKYKDSKEDLAAAQEKLEEEYKDLKAKITK